MIVKIRTDWPEQQIAAELNKAYIRGEEHVKRILCSNFTIIEDMRPLSWEARGRGITEIFQVTQNDESQRVWWLPADILEEVIEDTNEG